MTGYKEVHSRGWLPPPLPEYSMSWSFVLLVCTALFMTRHTLILQAYHDASDYFRMNCCLVVKRGSLTHEQGWLNLLCVFFLDFSFVEIGNQSLLGVSPSDFAKQVLSMLLPVFLPNKIIHFHLICQRFPASTHMRTVASNKLSVRICYRCGWRTDDTEGRGDM